MATVTASRAAELVKSALPEAFISSSEKFGETYICVRREQIPQVLEFLRESPELQFDYFSECVGVDYSTWQHERDLPERFEVVYNLMATSTAARVFVKVGVDDGQSVPTCKHVFAGAEYPEREIQDLFGIPFEGNAETPGMRFLLPDDWAGYPLRKEFPLGGEDVVFDQDTKGPAVEDVSMPHAGESFEGKTGSEDVGGR